MRRAKRSSREDWGEVRVRGENRGNKYAKHEHTDSERVQGKINGNKKVWGEQ